MWIPLEDAFLFRSKEDEILFVPPPKKKAQGYKRLQYGYTHTTLYLFVAAVCDLDFYYFDIEWFDTTK